MTLHPQFLICQQCATVIIYIVLRSYCRKVDTNEEYDSLDIREHDEQERYFDNEEPETLDMESDAQCEAVPNPMVDGTRRSEEGPDNTTGCNKQLANLHEKQKESTEKQKESTKNISSVPKLTDENT